MKIIQQGDILFVPIEKIPDEVKLVLPQNNKYVLAEGEATGHTHSILVSPRVSPRVKVVKDNKGLYLQINSSSVSVVHEEHKTRVIPRGNWEVRRINEWNYDEKQAKKISD